VASVEVVKKAGLPVIFCMVSWANCRTEPDRSGMVNSGAADGGAAIAVEAGGVVAAGADVSAGAAAAGGDDGEAIATGLDDPGPAPAPHAVRTTVAKTAEMSTADLFITFSPLH
jgi:hypothetical protein